MTAAQFAEPRQTTPSAGSSKADGLIHAPQPRSRVWVLLVTLLLLLLLGPLCLNGWWQRMESSQDKFGERVTKRIFVGEQQPGTIVGVDEDSPGVFEQLFRASALLGQHSVAHRASASPRFHVPPELRELTRQWVSNARTIASCGLDVTLLQALPQLQEQRIIVVSNLRDNEQLLPHYMQQLVTAAALLPGEVFVSIYESGSADRTHELLKQLEEALRLVGVRSNIVWAGNLTRKDSEDRIEFLSKVRNAALAPLFSRAFRKRFNPDRVVFVNDVHFCANDLLRLALHQADLACGLDMVVDEHRGQLFYDFWVMRDVAGARASDTHPFFKHQPSIDRLKEGMPLPAQCCWNGMAAVTAEVFKRGVKMRANQPGECRASECSLLCDDLHRLGLRDVVVDPSVRVSYKAEDFTRVHEDPGALGPYVPWAKLAGKPSYRDLARSEAFQRSDRVECCALPPGKDQIAWGDPEACEFVDILAVNYTKPFVSGRWFG